MPTVPAVRVSQNIYYLHNSVHRNRTPRKSQWTINETAELGSFQMALNQNWLLPQEGWGLHFENGNPAYLGLAQDHTTRVFVAKFVDRGNRNTWHGYPADHQKNNQDIPTVEILDKWLNRKVLPAPKIRKLAKGQPCGL